MLQAVGDVRGSCLLGEGSVFGVDLQGEEGAVVLDLVTGAAQQGVAEFVHGQGAGTAAVVRRGAPQRRLVVPCSRPTTRRQTRIACCCLRIGKSLWRVRLPLFGLHPQHVEGPW